MKLNCFARQLAIAALSTGVVGAAQAITIDTFEDSQSVVDMTVGDGAATDTITALLGVPGADSRTISVDLLSSTAGGNASLRIDDAGNNLLSMNSGAATTAILSVSYDYSTTPLDLLADGSDSFRLDGVQNDRDTIDLTVTVTDINGAIGMAGITDLPEFTGGQDFFIEYSSFSNSVDFSQITALEISVDATESTLGADLLFESADSAAQAVPLPGTLLLLAGGLFFSRRKKIAE